MKVRWILVICTTAFVAALALPLPAAGLHDQPAEDVSGTWELKLESPGGSGSATLVLRQQGRKITGRYRGRMGESAVEGSIDGKRIEFSVVLKFQDTSYNVRYSGTVEGDAMRGNAQFDDSGSGRWSARRVRG